MVLLIDNYDSFTYNLYQQVAGLGHEVIVKKNDEIDIDDIRAMSPSHILISAGPKRPADSGISMDVLKHFYTTIPILGVCLGHQCIGELFGANIANAPVVVHGKTDRIYHNQDGIFAGVPQPLIAARYNSLIMESLPNDLMLIAESADGTIQAVQHTTYPVFGVQFHPESFMTQHGDILMRNFLQCK